MIDEKRVFSPPVVMIILLAALVTACGGSAATVQLTYRCEGSATEADITYTGADGEPVDDESSLPWEVTVERGGNLVGFGVEAVSSADGDVTCSLLIDGEPIASESDEVSVALEAQYTYSGGTREVNVTTSRGSSTTAPAAEFDLEGAAFVINNQSQFDVCELYIGPNPEEGWGGNLLPVGRQLLIGSGFPLDEAPDETTAVRAVSCEGRVIAMSGYFGYEVDDDMNARLTNTGQTRPTLVVNQVQADICAVRVAEVDQDTFSADMLNDEEIIPSGELKQFRLPIGTWQLQTETCEGEVAEVTNISLQPQLGYAWNLTSTALLAGQADASGDTITVTVYNGGSLPICGVYIVSSDDDDSWGRNYMESEEPLNEGDNFTVYDVENGFLDLLIEGCEGEIVNFSLNTDFLSLTADVGPNIPYTTSATPDMTVVNTTEQEICALQFSREEGEFSRNLLLDPIPAGDELPMNFVTGVLNLRAESCDGEEFIQLAEEVTEDYVWEITAEGQPDEESDDEG